MKRLALIGWVGIMAMAVALGLGGVGCDTVTDATTVITFEKALLTATGLYAEVLVVLDTNATLYLPLRWSVSDPSLGTITSQGGLTALYQGTARPGVNTITVRDQGDAEGIALVNHVLATGMELTPTTVTTSNDWALVHFEVTPDPGLILPLMWYSKNAGMGVFKTSGGYEAVYEVSDRTGFNYITVTDQSGAQTSAIIQHL
jgi:hypothetical protein